MTFDIKDLKGIENYVGQAVNPVLIVLGGSIAQGLEHKLSDIDVFCFHSPETGIEDVFYFGSKREFDPIQDLNIDISPYGRFQLVSESTEYIKKYIKSGDLYSIYKIEGVLACPRLYEDTENKYYQSLYDFTSNIASVELSNLYIRNAEDRLRLINIENYIHEKIVFQFMRFTLAGINLKETKELIIDAKVLIQKYGIDIDWNKYFNNTERTKNKSELGVLINKTKEILKRCK